MYMYFIFHFWNAILAENCQLETIWISAMIHKFYVSQILCCLIYLQLVNLPVLEGINIRNFSIKPYTQFLILLYH